MATTAFSKILIPVDFSINTEIAIKKAFVFIEHFNAEIHLLHIVKPQTGAAAKFVIWEAEKKLAEWKALIEETTKEIKVHSTILHGSSIETLIIETATILSIDLIIVGKRSNRRSWLFSHSVSPDHIARKSDCPVLTVKPGSIHSRTKIIVLPVRDFVPERKLKLAVLIAKKCKAHVHLLAIRENKKGTNEEHSQPFLSAYHQLRESLHQPVEYFPISRHNTAKSILDYAESVMADMILLHPATESGVSTLIGLRHISNWIGYNSKIQVLDVKP